MACGRFLAPAGGYFPALHEPVAAEDLVDAALAEVAAGARWIKPRGRRTGGRAHDDRWARELINAGIDSIEHGNQLTEADLAALADRVGAWTPTLRAGVGADPGDDPDRRRRHGELRERLRYLLPRAASSGVTVLAGTDVVGSLPQEVALLVEFGLPPRQALAAASTAARRFLGISDFRTGRLADVVAYHDDRREHAEVLANPAAIVVQGRRLR